jgi:hypothetical protein
LILLPDSKASALGEEQEAERMNIQVPEDRREYCRFETTIPVHHRIDSQDRHTAETEKLAMAGILRNVSLKGLRIDFQMEVLDVCDVLSEMGKGSLFEMEVPAGFIEGGAPLRGVVKWFRVDEPDDGYMQHFRAGLFLDDPESCAVVNGILESMTGSALAQSFIPGSVTVLSMERRRHPRVKATCPLLHFSEIYPGPTAASTLDLSVGGTRMETFYNLIVGQRLGISFSIPSEVIQCKGEVIHILQSTDGKQQAGIRFDDLSKQDRLRVEDYILELQGGERGSTSIGLTPSEIESQEGGTSTSSCHSSSINPNTQSVIDLEFFEDARGVLRDHGRVLCMKCIAEDLSRIGPVNDESLPREVGRVITKTDLETEGSVYTCDKCGEEIR